MMCSSVIHKMSISYLFKKIKVQFFRRINMSIQFLNMLVKEFGNITFKEALARLEKAQEIKPVIAGDIDD